MWVQNNLIIISGLNKMRKQDKKIRREKQKAFQEEKHKKQKTSKVCKVTKGEHVYDVPDRVDYRQGYTLICACGKKNWNVPTLRPVGERPKYMICKKHGMYAINDRWGKVNKKYHKCWACELGLPVFKDNI